MKTIDEIQKFKVLFNLGHTVAGPFNRQELDKFLEGKRYPYFVTEWTDSLPRPPIPRESMTAEDIRYQRN